MRKSPFRRAKKTVEVSVGESVSAPVVVDVDVSSQAR